MAYPVLRYENARLFVLDQTQLPWKTVMLELVDLESVEQAIRTLQVRGAPLIGITAAYGVCVAMNGIGDRERARLRGHEALRRLAATRPTAVNLFWALERMRPIVEALPAQGWRKRLEAEARAIHAETEAQDAAMAEYGVGLLAAGAKVITHCNTGPLATGGRGTALGVLIAGHAKLGLHVYVDETRPRWQGAHLTTWELDGHHVPHTLICDNSAAMLMRSERIHSVWVGADRIAANGDTANKIGTFALAIAARHHGVPFYVVAPTSTVDLALDDGSTIPIEQRSPHEVSEPDGHPIAPAGTAAWNPAFDVTPADLITGIVTERGVLRGTPYDLRAALGAA